MNELFGIPLGSLLVALVVLLGGAALRASRIRPAEALRYE